MWEDFKYKRAVSLLQKSRDKIWKEFEVRRRGRKDDGSPGWDDTGAMLEVAVTENELMMLRSNYLRALAAKYFLPIPSYNTKVGGDWQYTADGSFGVHLTIEAQRKLEAEIRAERNTRSEKFIRWFPLVIGLIGAVTGLVAVLKK